jgi:hypothetical protein
MVCRSESAEKAQPRSRKSSAAAEEVNCPHDRYGQGMAKDSGETDSHLFEN